MNNIKKRKSEFTQVFNTFLRDKSLSFKAKGLFCYMFSMTEEWNFTIQSIATQQKDGTASIISALDELKEHGYITYIKHPNGKGTYHLDDKPNVGNPNVENPNLGKSTRIKEDQLDKNKKSKSLTLLEQYIKDDCNITDISIDYLKDFIQYRIDIKKPLKTIAPLKAYTNVLKELWVLKYKLHDCINIMKEREWLTLKLEYIHKEKNTLEIPEGFQ